MSLRDYQENGVIGIKLQFKRGLKKVLLWLATGGGKTVVFCHIVKESMSRGKHCLIVVRGRKLVDQASLRLFREHVPHGVLMAKHWNYRPYSQVQVCSIDTLIARGLRPKADVIIVDEAHLFAKDSKADEFLRDYEGKAYIVAVTATPYVQGGLRHLADAIVHPITMQELIDQGFLVPFRYFAPTEPDMSGVKIDSKTKDYNTAQTEERMVAGQLTGKIIDHWKVLGQNRPTLLFAVNVNHSRLLAEKFNEAGITAEHCDADVPDKERNEIIKRLEAGKTKIICNVGIFCTGVDIPCIGSIILARPTQSLNLFVQQTGRGTRPIYADGFDLALAEQRLAAISASGQADCILLDHAGNIKRHGFPTMEPDVDLDGKFKSERGQKESKICKTCFAIYRGKICPECGVEPPSKPTKLFEETEEQLQEIIVTQKDPILQYLELLEKRREQGRHKNGWQFYKLIEKFDYEKCEPHLPDWFKRRYNDKATLDPFANSPFKFSGGIDGKI